MNDFGELTDRLNDGSISVKPQDDDPNDDSGNDENCIDINGEELCLSVYIDESEVQESMDPAIQAAKEIYLYAKGFSDQEIEDDILSEWDGSEEHLVPFVMYLAELGGESSTTSSLEFRNLFNSAYAQSTPELTADEIWDCAVEAVGLGFVSAVGMHGAKKAGIKMLTKSFTKFVSRFAGPIGAAIMVADFGFCLYGAAND